MSRYGLHGRGRKQCPVYSHRYDPANDRETPKVFRPRSDRQVSAVHELNRLQAKLEAAEALIKKIGALLVSLKRRRPPASQCIDELQAKLKEYGHG